jgi:hypothetical protein
MKETNPLKIWTVALPVLSVVVAAGVTAYEWNRVRGLEADRDRMKKNIAVLDRLQERMNSEISSPQVPAVAQTVSEQPLYLNNLRTLAAATRVKLVKWTNSAPYIPTNQQQLSNNEVQPTLPQGITAISSDVEVMGGYEDVRQFLYAVAKSPRLYNMSRVRWTRNDKWPQTGVQFTLVRYVTAAPAATPEPNRSASLETPQAGQSNNTHAGPGEHFRAGGAVTPAADTRPADVAARGARNDG